MRGQRQRSVKRVCVEGRRDIRRKGCEREEESERDRVSRNPNAGTGALKMKSAIGMARTAH